MPSRLLTTDGGDAPVRALVDSGAWIALVRAKDQHHEAADRLFRLAIRQHTRLFTTNLIVAEVHRFILFHMGSQPASLVLDRINASPLLSVEFTTAAHHRKARQWLARFPDQRLTYTDAMSFAVMEANRCTTAMGFDHDFEAAGFSLWRP
ncbi:MAG: PIN domain-containing protein [Deltaproteobacteria bacterium]|nr:PIN domain-containing protein [Deltaproteobacteria bacterium]